MVNYLAEYRRFMTHAEHVYDELVKLYASSELEDQEAMRNAGEAEVYRKGLREDIALPRQEIFIEDTSPFIVSTKHYIDGHWGDFTTYPVPGPTGNEYPATDLKKRQRLVRLHAELTSIIKEVAQIDLALR